MNTQKHENKVRAICVTGTPALSRPAELFMQLKALMPQSFSAFHPFAVRRVTVRVWLGA